METEVVASGANAGLILIIQIALIAVAIIGLWKLFTKAGQPGWASIIPIYNSMVMLEIAGKPMWWVVLLFIPIVNIVVSVLMIVGLAKNFGRGTGTVIGLILLPFIFLMVLGFGSAEYNRVEG